MQNSPILSIESHFEMQNASYDVLAIGNAIVDVLAQVEDDFLIRENIHKGSMNLIDEARAEYLSNLLGKARTISGGSAANTAAGIASLGSRSAFIGKVKSDTTGAMFRHDIELAGVRFKTDLASSGPATARSFILVTPDGQRSMNTYLGACQGLAEADVDEAQVRDSALVYLEGYLWDPPAAKKAFLKASHIAHANGRKVALTLSDSFCVDRYREEFLGLIQDRTVDIVFANTAELHSLYQTADFDTAVTALRAENVLGIVTRGELGSLIVTHDAVLAVPAHPIRQIVDTTGAGDLFAAGFLHGLATGRDHAISARFGGLAAAEIIQHIGARPEQNLADLLKLEPTS